MAALAKCASGSRAAANAGARGLIYAIVLHSTAIALLDVYAKSEQGDLTAHERKAIASSIREIEEGFDR